MENGTLRRLYVPILKAILLSIESQPGMSYDPKSPSSWFHDHQLLVAAVLTFIVNVSPLIVPTLYKESPCYAPFGCGLGGIFLAVLLEGAILWVEALLFLILRSDLKKRAIAWGIPISAGAFLAALISLFIVGFLGQ
jgi:hypothetical protein